MPQPVKSRGATHESTAVQPDGVNRGRPASKIARLAAVARGIYNNDRQLQFVLFAIMLFWYGLLLAFSWRANHGAQYGRVFNSMLDHLLRGQFDVDPQAVKDEGYLHNGRVYAYWGIWCALLRLPLWIVRRMDVDMTAWSCLAAVCLAGMAKVRAALLVRRQSVKNQLAGLAVALMLAYILLGGSEIGYLAASVYQEVVSWAAAFGAVFVYYAVKGLVNNEFDLTTLSAMSLCAGLALLTRATTGIGLSIALVLLLLVLVIEPGKVASRDNWTAIRRLGRAITDRRIVLPVAILAVLIALTGAVNYFRWGNPATFVKLYGDDFNSALMTSAANLGVFNFRRIPFGLVYYFFPVWVLHGSDGQLILERTRSRLFDMTEFPPSSFLLTDLLPFCFIVLLAAALWKHRTGRLPIAQGLALAAGLLAPCILTLLLIWASYRYRMEFYPEMDLLAFLGLYLAVTDEALLATFARWRRWMTAALAVSIVSSFVAFSLYNLRSDGPMQRNQGIVGYYYQQIVQRSNRVKVLYFHSR